MRIWQIALREISRRKVRTLYTASSIMLSVTLLIAALLIGVAGQKDLLLTIARYGHSLTIFPATSSDVSLQQFGIGSGHYIPEDLIPEIQRIYEHAIRAGWEKKGGFVLDAGIIGGIDNLQPATFVPRLYEETTINGRKVVVAGVHAEDEYKVRFWWEVEQGRLLTRSDEVMIGKVFAAATSVKVSDTLEINGQRFTVSGVLRDTDSPDDYMVFADLKTVQSLFGKPGRVSLINVRAMCNYCPVGEAELAINQKAVGVRATSQREIATAQHRIFRNVTNVVLGLTLLALLIACMAVFNMIMGSIHGRMREAGVLKVVGASRWQLMRLFMYEALGLGLIGGIAGYALGHAAAWLIGPWLVNGIVIETHWSFLALALLAATLTSVLATLYPAIEVSRIRPAVAFRVL